METKLFGIWIAMGRNEVKIDCVVAVCFVFASLCFHWRVLEIVISLLLMTKRGREEKGRDQEKEREGGWEREGNWEYPWFCKRDSRHLEDDSKREYRWGSNSNEDIFIC